MSDTPCTRCGACCAQYRVAFHWLEAAALPQEMVVRIDAHRVAMRGTAFGGALRCCALEGAVGTQVHCRVYAQRPPPCRDLQPDGHDGRPSEQCRRARAQYGLPPLPECPAQPRQTASPA